MSRTRVGAVAFIAALLGFAGCGSSTPDDAGDPAPPSSSPANAPDLLSDTSARGRVAFGCALERGIEGADGTMRRYGNMAARLLFTAALEAKFGYADAARLWNASDAVLSDDSDRARSRLLAICSAAGFTGEAALAELRSYTCAMAGDLARGRPSVGSFGPESTRKTPGDPRRSDLSFVQAARFLLSMEDTPEWLDGEDPADALAAGDNERYEAALRAITERCG